MNEHDNEPVRAQATLPEAEAGTARVRIGAKITWGDSGREIGEIVAVHPNGTVVFDITDPVVVSKLGRERAGGQFSIGWRPTPAQPSVRVDDAVPADTLLIVPPKRPDETAEEHAARSAKIVGLDTSPDPDSTPF